jgi:hypothetical protein
MGSFASVSEKVLSSPGVQSKGEIKLHLGLTGANAEKTDMDM